MPVPTISLDELLHGKPAWFQVREFWRDADFDGEENLIAAIEKHLLTELQRKTIFDMKLSIEKMLNQRYGGGEEPLVHEIYKVWNYKLGLPAFGNFPQAEIEIHSDEQADALYLKQRKERPELYPPPKVPTTEVPFTEDRFLPKDEALPEFPPVADDCGRPNFTEFAQALRKESQWIRQLHGDGNKPSDAGQSISDANDLVRLAEKVEKIGKSQGYIA